MFGKRTLCKRYIIGKQGRLAQLVRAAALHAVGQGFESLVAHFLQFFTPLCKPL
jgi:hypothetical protein